MVWAETSEVPEMVLPDHMGSVEFQVTGTEIPARVTKIPVIAGSPQLGPVAVHWGWSRRWPCGLR